MLKSVQSSDYIKYSLAAIERGVRLCNDKSKQVSNWSRKKHCFEFYFIHL